MSTALALKTLLLNADFQPMSTYPPSLITGREAVEYVLGDRASVVEEWPEELRSPSRSIAVPKVLALNTYASVTRSPRFCRRNVFLRDRFHCQYCGEKFPTPELTLDHVIPKSRGGRTIWENILACCVDCNRKKQDKLPNYSGRRGSDKHGMRPLKEPRRPTHHELIQAGAQFLDQTIIETWGSWLYWTTDLT